MEKVYHKPTNSIVELTLELKQQIKESNTTNEYSKILALPEHFSPKHLQAIVDGKMLVECDKMWNEIDGEYKVIKLNQSNHITLHKIEEKMYTREELKEWAEK